MCVYMKTHIFYGILSSGSVLGDVCLQSCLPVPSCSHQASRVLNVVTLRDAATLSPCTRAGSIVGALCHPMLTVVSPAVLRFCIR